MRNLLLLLSLLPTTISGQLRTTTEEKQTLLVVCAQAAMKEAAAFYNIPNLKKFRCDTTFSFQFIISLRYTSEDDQFAWFSEFRNVGSVDIRHYINGNKFKHEAHSKYGVKVFELWFENPDSLNIYHTIRRYDNGQRMMDGYSDGGKDIGKWTHWYKNGYKKMEGVYELFPHHQGRPWYRPVGEWRYWNDEGSLIKLETHHDGKMVNVQEYHQRLY